jgi:hypothetical protein
VCERSAQRHCRTETRARNVSEAALLCLSGKLQHADATRG